MNRYYVTFGQAHTHRINGNTVDCDTALAVDAETYAEARRKVVDAIGPVWAFMYGPEDNFDVAKWCPKGVVVL